jgi:hypothetical protein
MADVSDDLVPRVLRAYADLCATGSGSDGLVIAPSDELATIPTSGGLDGSFGLIPHQHLGDPAYAPLQEHLPLPSTPVLERLAKLDALHRDEVLVRHSWVLVVGTTEIDGELRQVLQPLLSRPVRLERRGLLSRVAGAMNEFDTSKPYALTYLGDASMNPAIDDPDRRAHLLDTAAFGRGSLRTTTSEALLARMPELTGWIRSAAIAAGWPVHKIVAPDESPSQWLQRRGLVAIPVHCLHTTRRISPTSLRTTLLGWTTRRDIDRTALGHVLGVGGAPERVEQPRADVAVESPMLLSRSQRDVVLRARTQPVTVVSGAPGSGKTHALCAVALDTVAAGGSVLVATQSRYAADVVAELLDRTPGPSPVRFGDGAGMAALIDELADRMTHPPEPAQVRQLDRALDRARAEAESLRAEIAAQLQLEADAQLAHLWRRTLPALVADAPAVFEPTSDLSELGRLLAAAEAPSGTGWFARRRHRRAARRLLVAAGAQPGTSVARLANAIEAARAGRAAATLDAGGGIEVGDRFSALADATSRLREALGQRLRVGPITSSGPDDSARSSLVELSTALRAGRGRRRELLAEMRPRHMTTAAPLWVGTLTDIEDVLPAVAGLFDLVILDEASQIEQTRAAPALLRGTRALVVGDPHQLRHVSFRSDADIQGALSSHGLSAWQGFLDVRRVSAFDLAAAAAPIDVLREHFRSVPHLIEFSVRTFYRDRVSVMTRHPRNEELDAIDVVAPAPIPSTERSVRRDEVLAVTRLVRARADAGGRDIGVISPFREQADALEHALMDEFSAVELQQLGLRVGTVHSFQGGERDTVIASLGLGADDPAGRRRFVEQPNLFNVMITRARRQMIVVTSLPADGAGLVGEYLRYAAAALPPVSRTDRDRTDAPTWREALAEELARYGTVRVDYPVGPWLLDLCFGDGDDAVLLECGVHPDGVDAHIERRLTLMGLGWQVRDAFPSRWEHNAARAALELR